jgi:hypothetical protein
MMSIDQAFQRSTELSDWLSSVLHEQGTVEEGRRERIALVYVSLALDHREAFRLLLEQGARATAMAVTRPILEAYVRGLWAFHLASEDQMKNFLEDRYDPSVERVFQGLKKLTQPHGQVFEILRNHYGTLCDYAHGGPRQVSRWLRTGEVMPRYSDDQMIEALRFVDLVGVLASMARERIMGHPTDAFDGKVNELLT